MPSPLALLLAALAAQPAERSPAAADTTLTAPSTPAKQPGADLGPAEPGAFPTDVPQRYGANGRRAIELDLYLGPSYASTGAGGLGLRAAVVNHQANPKNFGLKWFAAAGGGYYPVGLGGVANQTELLGNAEVGIGYLGIVGLEDGTAPQAFANFLSVSADVLTRYEAIYSYTPNLQVGILGRNAKNDDAWNLHLHLGGNFSYLTGQYEKLGPGGAPENWLADPWAQLSLSTDLYVSRLVFLRLGANVGDTIDLLGADGVRHIVESRVHAYLKIGRTLWTGPALVFDDAGKIADFQTGTYVPAPPIFTVSWLIGGALNPG